MKLKVAIVIDRNPFFESSAASNRWRTLIEGLLMHGNEVMMIITGGFLNPREYKAMGFSGKDKGISYRYVNILFHHNIWLRRLNNFILNPLMQVFIKGSVSSAINKFDPHIVWTSTNIESFKLAHSLKSRNSKRKYFLEMSEFLDIYKENVGSSLQKSMDEKRQNFFEKTAFYSYDGIALMTNTLMDHYRKFPGRLPEFLHLPMTVDLDRFKVAPPVPEGVARPYIAFVGVMNNKKDGINILIDAFAKISAKYPSLHLYFYGFYHHDRPSQQKQVEDYGLQDRIIYKGSVSRDEIPAVIMNAEVLVLPRPSSKQAEGGFPTKLGEYLATGKPVCATRVGEIPQYLMDGENAFLAEPDSADSFADALDRALSDTERALEVGRKGRETAQKHFNKEVQAKTLNDFLISLTENK